MNDNINFNAMKKEDICKYANDYFGLVLDPNNYKKDELIQIVKDSTPGGDYTMAEPVTEDTNGIKTGYVRIIISRSGDKKQPPVFWGHQGDHYLAKRGHEVDIPAKSISALADAIEDAFIYDEDTQKGDGSYGAEIRQKVQSYPFSVIEWGKDTEKHQATYRESRKQLSY